MRRGNGRSSWEQGEGKRGTRTGKKFHHILSPLTVSPLHPEGLVHLTKDTWFCHPPTMSPATATAMAPYFHLGGGGAIGIGEYFHQGE